jgi:hypothetical protein
MRNRDREKIYEPIIEDEDDDAKRREYKKLRALRFERPSMVLIEKCISAEEGSVYKMALKHMNTDNMAADKLLEHGFLDKVLDHEGIPTTEQVHGYCLLDDINAGVLRAYIAGYMAAFMGGDKDEQ